MTMLSNSGDVVTSWPCSGIKNIGQTGRELTGWCVRETRRLASLVLCLNRRCNDDFGY